MALTLTQSTQFKIKELSLVTKLGVVNLANIYQEINIFDSMFMPCMKGDIFINDSIGLADKLVLDGSEYIIITISKDEENNQTHFDRTFRVVSISSRQNTKQNSESYILHFVSEEMVFSLQQKINQSYNSAYSNMVEKILVNQMGVSKDKIAYIEKTKGIHSLVLPNISPLDAMNWVTKKAVNDEGLPNLLFFENNYGYNFVSLSTLIGRGPIITLNAEVKNVEGSEDTEFYGARDIKVVNQFNHIENVRNGVYAGKFIGIDPMTRKVNVQKIDFTQTYNKTKKHLNKYPNFAGSKNRAGKDSSEMHDSKVSLYVFSTPRITAEYIKRNDSKTATIIDDTHAYVFQRAPILANLLQMTIHMNIPGNFGITSGYVVELKLPSRSLKTNKDDVIDDSMSGNYLITATHQMITNDKHVTIIEVAADSTNRIFSTEQSPEMTEAVTE